MPEPGELLSAFDKACRDLNLSQEHIQDLIAKKITDDRVAYVAPASSPRPTQEELFKLIRQSEKNLDPVNEQRRNAAFHAMMERRKNLTYSEAERQELLLRRAQLWIAETVETLATKYSAVPSQSNKVVANAFRAECEAQPLSLWNARRREFDTFPNIGEETFLVVIRHGREYGVLISDQETRSRLQMNDRFPSFEERIESYVDKILTRDHVPDSSPTMPEDEGTPALDSETRFSVGYSAASNPPKHSHRSTLRLPNRARLVLQMLGTGKSKITPWALHKKFGGPYRSTTDKVLAGLPVREDALERLVTGLQAAGKSVTRRNIPDD